MDISVHSFLCLIRRSEPLMPNGGTYMTLSFQGSTKVIEQWRVHYNTVRPHSALGYRPLAPESIVPMDQRPTMHYNQTGSPDGGTPPWTAQDSRRIWYC